MPEALGWVNSIVIVARLGHHLDMKPVPKCTFSLRLLTMLGLAGVVLAACGPLSIYYRPGVTVSRMQNDQLNCEVSALRDAPVATQIRQRPPIFFPGRRWCDASGACYSQPGYWVDGGVYTVDTNADLRARVLNQCMAQKGYQPVDVPPCPVSVVNAATPGQTSKLPPLTPASCVIKNNDGSWQIVDRG